MRIKKPIYIKYRPRERSNLVQIKDEVEYKYYKCEYCGDEIIITDKAEEMTGGIVKIPMTLTGDKSEYKVICNKCVIPMIKRYEEKYIKWHIDLKYQWD